MYGSNIVTRIKLFWYPPPPQVDFKIFDWLITEKLIN